MTRKSATPAEKIIAAWYRQYDARIAKGQTDDTAKKMAAAVLRWTPEFAELLPTRGTIHMNCLIVQRTKADDVDNIVARYDMSYS